MSKHQRPRQTPGQAMTSSQRQTLADDSSSRPPVNPESRSLAKQTAPLSFHETPRMSSLAETPAVPLNAIKPQMTSLTNDNVPHNTLQIPPRPILYFREDTTTPLHDFWPHGSPYTPIFHPSFHLRENPFQYLPFMFEAKSNPHDDSPTVDIYLPKPHLTNYLKMRTIQRDRRASSLRRKSEFVPPEEYPDAEEVEKALQRVTSYEVTSPFDETEEDNLSHSTDLSATEEEFPPNPTAVAEKGMKQFRKCLCCYCPCCPLKKKRDIKPEKKLLSANLSRKGLCSKNVTISTVVTPTSGSNADSKTNSPVPVTHTSTEESLSGRE